MQDCARPRLDGPCDLGTCKPQPRLGHLEDQRRAPFIGFDKAPAGCGHALVPNPSPRLSAVAKDLRKCFTFRFDHPFAGGPRRDHLMQIPGPQIFEVRLDSGIVVAASRRHWDGQLLWIADALAQKYPEQAIGLYTGASRSRLYQSGESVSIERETLKKMVAAHELKIMVATDAACEGLNLQTLGTLINIDLPWNPTRLEQRIGRIKRFGQARVKVDMLNLVNEQTVDEKVYERLSERMRDRYNLFGSLPDTIKDEWIDDIETLGLKMDEYINAQKEATGFDLRYQATAEASEKEWRDCSEVLSRRDFAALMRAGWS